MNAASPDSESSFASTAVGDDAKIRQFAIEVARLVQDDKCEDVLVLDVRKLSQVSDYIVIATGTSDRQIKSVQHHAIELGEEQGNPVFGASGDEASTWVIADFVDVVLHLFEPNTRAYYDLETLWGDAARIAWERQGDASRNRAGLRVDDILEDESD